MEEGCRDQDFVRVTSLSPNRGPDVNISLKTLKINKLVVLCFFFIVEKNVSTLYNYKFLIKEVGIFLYKEVRESFESVIYPVSGLLNEPKFKEKTKENTLSKSLRFK